MASNTPSPQPPNNSSKSPAQQKNWGLWILMLAITGILLFAFNFNGKFGGAVETIKFDDFKQLYRQGDIVLNSSKDFPIIVSSNSDVASKSDRHEGVLTAYVYKKSPKLGTGQFYLPFTDSENTKTIFNNLGITDMKNIAAPADSQAQRVLSTDKLVELGKEGRIINSEKLHPIIYNFEGRQVLVGNYRKLPTTVPKRDLLKSVEVKFSSRFEGEQIKDLLGNKAKYEVDNNVVFSVIMNFLPFLLIIGLFIFIFRAQAGGGPSAAMKFSKSKARLIDADKDPVTFKDVAGISEAMEEVWEIVEFLRNTKKFSDLGGAIPKGVLIIGAPGTGKTLLARAIAGEAKVPFYSISGSDFVEMFVGVGASRVRDMFAEAKRNAPCLIFIDEIDAVGRHRGHGIGGGHDEREQTLNALLVEMDGFSANENVIVIAATNRVDVLDPALLRPGRFDRQVVVHLPDAGGREQILRVHARKIKLAESIDFRPIARATTGFSGAELANLVNEAALIAARKNQKVVMQADFEESREKVRWGRERRSLEVNDREKLMTAVHEAGHAICLLKTGLRKTLPLHKVTIIPRGPALGMTMMLPEEDKHSEHKSELLDYIVMAMGGRVAEEVYFGDISGGASGDIHSATAIARKMVCVYGMSERLGPVQYGSNQGEVFLARDMAHTAKNFSEHTARIIDEEIQRIIEDNYKRAQDIINSNKEELKLIADKLIEFETLTGDQILDLLETRVMKNPPQQELPPPIPEDSDQKTELQEYGEEQTKLDEEAGNKSKKTPFEPNSSSHYQR